MADKNSFDCNPYHCDNWYIVVYSDDALDYIDGAMNKEQADEKMRLLFEKGQQAIMTMAPESCPEILNHNS